MAAVVPLPGFDPSTFLDWVAAQPDCAAQWVPRFLRVVSDPPRTATGKVVVRTLAALRWDEPEVWIRDGDRLRPMTDEDRAALAQELVRSGRVLP
jgi:fatty-acyl-CoA synthase